MPVTQDESLEIRGAGDIVAVRQQVRARAAELGFSLVDQTKLVTAASELARNTLDYGGGGTVRIECIVEGGRHGIRLTFEDRGPGIPDVAEALRDGFSSGKGLGLGLGGARRLVNEFELDSRVGEGTRVRVARWR
jgi:serine/threonine-protein kinase RsbT